MIISPLMLILILLLVLALSGSGYGYYSGGAYANPLGVLGLLLIIAVVVLLLTGWSFTATPP